jgi:hypothetical protein
VVCDIPVAIASENENYAIERAREEYPVNTELELFIDKNTDACFTQSNVEALAITGLVFFCFTGVNIIVLIIIRACACREN